MSNYNQILKELNEIKSALQVSDMVNKEQACNLLGINKRTMTNYISQGKIAPESVNELGHYFFSRKKLLGLFDSPHVSTSGKIF